MRSKTLLPITTLAVSLALLTSACSANETIVATPGSTDELALEAPTSVTSSDGEPGFNALRSKGCDAGDTPEAEESEWGGWLPLAQLVDASNTAIEGRIEKISSPRISTLTTAAPPGGPAQMYFRIVDLSVTRSDPYKTDAKIDPTIQMIVFGAGPDVESTDLCFGPDGTQDSRELPLEVGDSVVAIGEVRQFPIVGLKEPVLFLPTGLIGLWKIEETTARSVVPEFAFPADMIFDRVQLQVAASQEGRDVTIKDNFSVPPEQEDEESIPTTSVLVPEPPGPDAPDTPTIPTPADIDE